MCSGIEYQDQIHAWKDPEVKLPVLNRDGSVSWLTWGARHGIPSPFVQGPCARLESIQAGKWDQYQPISVKVPMQRYMERDHKGSPFWVKAEPHQYLQGLVATLSGEQRIYVVTIETPEAYRHVQPRWPRLVS